MRESIDVFVLFVRAFVSMCFVFVSDCFVCCACVCVCVSLFVGPSHCVLCFVFGCGSVVVYII